MRAAFAAICVLLSSGCAVSTQGQVVEPWAPIVAEEGSALVYDPIPMAFSTVGEMMGGTVEESCIHWRRDPEWVLGMMHHILYPARFADAVIIDYANRRCT